LFVAEEILDQGDEAGSGENPDVYQPSRFGPMVVSLGVWLPLGR